MHVLAFVNDGRLDSANVAENGDDHITVTLIDYDNQTVEFVRHSPEWATRSEEELKKQIKHAEERFKTEGVVPIHLRLIRAAVRNNGCPSCGALNMLKIVDTKLTTGGRAETNYICAYCKTNVLITYVPVLTKFHETFYSLVEGE